MKNHLCSVVLLYVVLIAGCAHPYVITPELSTIDRKDVNKIAKNVGYYISAEDRALEVITPGGGGDKVKYTPYKDAEPALQKVLSNMFTQVHILKSLDNKQFIISNQISFIFIPRIETTSLSTSIITWPPTDFFLSLNCAALDPAGKIVWEKKIVGRGHAEYSEFKNDFQLAAKRASFQVFTELQRELNTASVFREKR